MDYLYGHVYGRAQLLSAAVATRGRQDEHRCVVVGTQVSEVGTHSSNSPTSTVGLLQYYLLITHTSVIYLLEPVLYTVVFLVTCYSIYYIYQHYIPISTALLYN